MDTSIFFGYPTEEESQQPLPQLSQFLPQHSPQEWRKLLAYTQTQRFKRDDFVFQAGQTERILYVVIFGQCESLKPAKGGYQNVAVIGEGDVIGEQTFLDGQPQETAVRATTDTEIARLNLDAFEVLAAREPQLARDILFDLGRIVSLKLRNQ